MTKPFNSVSAPSMVQYPAHQTQNGWNLQFISTPGQWLEPQEIQELVHPFEKIESRWINFKEITGWYGISHRGRQVETPEDHIPLLNIMRLLGVSSTRNVITQHYSVLDSRSTPCRREVWQCDLQAIERRDNWEYMKPIASLLIFKSDEPIGVKQRLSLGRLWVHRGEQWYEPKSNPQTMVARAAVAQMLENSRRVNDDCTLPVLAS